jgi:hypothetical protein
LFFSWHLGLTFIAVILLGFALIYNKAFLTYPAMLDYPVIYHYLLKEIGPPFKCFYPLPPKYKKICP